MPGGGGGGAPPAETELAAPPFGFQASPVVWYSFTYA